MQLWRSERLCTLKRGKTIWNEQALFDIENAKKNYSDILTNTTYACTHKHRKHTCSIHILSNQKEKGKPKIPNICHNPYGSTDTRVYGDTILFLQIWGEGQRDAQMYGDWVHFPVRRGEQKEKSQYCACSCPIQVCTSKAGFAGSSPIFRLLPKNIKKRGINFCLISV